jgi:PleD family two-component response regulator
MPVLSFSHKILLFVKSINLGNQINRILVSAGMRECEVEGSGTNIVTKLQSGSYEACILHYDTITSLTTRLVSSIRNSSVTSRLPIIVIAQDGNLEVISELYSAGANYVLTDSLKSKAKEVALLINSLIEYSTLFK